MQTDNQHMAKNLTARDAAAELVTRHALPTERAPVEARPLSECRIPSSIRLPATIALRVRGGLPPMLAICFFIFGLLSCSSGGTEPGGSEPDGPGSTASGRWSDLLTWISGELPTSGDNVLIGPGETILLDTATAPLDCLRIEGTLIADSAVDIGLTANCIEIMPGGTLQIGTETVPYDRQATITLTGPRGLHQARAEDNGLDNDGVQRAIRVMNGGSLKLFGATPQLLKAKLAAHATPGSTTLSLSDTVNWRAGDRIAVSLTDFFGVGETEVLTLAANTSGTTATTTTGLGTFRWGRLQYPLDAPISGSGMSLTPGAFTPPSPTTPTVLDERAEILNLSRRIVIEGADDSAWANDGFGVHVMVMGLDSLAQVRGVEFRRCGQHQAMGRYPFHWHMLSFTSANANGQGGGIYGGDAAPGAHYLKDSAIWQSQNRAVTIHGTCGVTVDNVYAVDIKGHAFFMEDGAEERNTITNCVAMKARDPGSAHRIKIHDMDASGFWLTNPNNIVTHNSGSDCSGRGIWNSFASQCFGQCRNSTTVPQTTNLLLHTDNTGHSNALQGIATNFITINEAGTTTEGGVGYNPVSQPFEFVRNITWKNNNNGYINRVALVNYKDWTAADNNGRDFIGRTNDTSALTGALLVGQSLNNATPFSTPHRISLSSYHFQLNIIDITAINYPFVSPSLTLSGQAVGGGVFDHSDMYTTPIAMSHARSTGWKLVNSNAGYLAPAPYFDGFSLVLPSNPSQYRYWSLAGAIHDVHGYWSAPGHYLLPSGDPFFTYGLSTSTPIAPAGANGVSTPDLFFGISSIQADAPAGWSLYHGPSLISMRCARLNTTNIEVGHHLIEDPNLAGFFPNMRHFTIAAGGRYEVTFPGGVVPSTRLSATLTNAYRPSDTVIFALPWSGGVVASGHLESEGNASGLSAKLAVGAARLYSNSGSNLVDVLNDPTGVTMWQDTANNRIWIRYVGGLTNNFPSGTSDPSLLRPYTIRLY